MNTEFFTKRVKRNKAKSIIGGGLGLSTAAVIWIYATFATKSELAKVEESNKAQWRAIAEMRAAVGLPPKTNTHP